MARHPSGSKATHARTGRHAKTIAALALLLMTLPALLTPAQAAPGIAPHDSAAASAPFVTEATPSAYVGDLRSLAAARPDGAAGDYRTSLRPERPGPPSLDEGIVRPLPAAGVGPQAPAPGPTANFAGLSQEDVVVSFIVLPPDTTGDVSPTYYVEAVNSGDYGSVIGVFQKSDGARVAMFGLQQLFTASPTGTTCDTANAGDGQVLYDGANDRWIIADFTGSGNPYRFCMAVSMSGDPVAGGWWLYSWAIGDNLFPDYPKMALWSDGGLYVTANMFGNTAYQLARVWAFNNLEMEAGATSHAVSVDLPGLIGNAFQPYSALPTRYHIATGTPSPGTPEFIAIGGQTSGDLSIWKFFVNWGNLPASILTGPTTVITASYVAPPANVASPTNTLDTLGDRLMTPMTWQRVGGVESLWLANTVRNPSVSGITSVRWNQIAVTGGTVVSPALQTSTFAPDTTTNRWLPSLAVDRAGSMLVGYSASNSASFPSLRYAGRLATDPVNTLSLTETTMFTGSGTLTGTCNGTCHRWGDYSAMSLDPDGCTFWYANEYYVQPYHATNPGYWWNTRIGSVQLPGCTPFVTTNGALAGTVTSGGNPVPGATVTATNGGTPLTATADANGAYAFPSLHWGAYSVSASAPGFTSNTVHGVAVNGGATATQGIALTQASQSACLATSAAGDLVACSRSSTAVAAGGFQLARTAVGDVSTIASTCACSGSTISTTTWQAQDFTPTVSGQLVAVDMDIFCSGCTGATTSITVEVRPTSGVNTAPTATVLASTALPSFTASFLNQQTATFASPPSLTAGTEYAIVLKLTAANAVGNYAWTFTSGTRPYAHNRYASTNSGSTWTATTTSNFFFKTTMSAAGYAPSGTVTSTLKDANPILGNAAAWTTLSWSATLPGGTDVKFQVAGSNDPAGPFNFVGPDGTAGTFFTTSGASLSQFNGLRYLEWRATLSSASSTATPTLASVTLCFVNPLVATPTLTTGSTIGPYGGTAPLTATLAAGAGLAGKVVRFTLQGTFLATALTDGSGTATLGAASLAGIEGGVYPAGIVAAFTGNGVTLAASNALTVTRPVTTAGLAGALGGNGWYTSTVTVTLTCTPTPGSSCAGTSYAVDGGSTATYAGPFAVAGDAASHGVTFQSTDSLGALGAAASQAIKIDATPPTLALAARAPDANAHGWNNGPVTATFACDDATSGAVSWTTSITWSLEGQGQSATAYCSDAAGNAATYDVTDVNIDLTPPEASASRTPNANAHGWNNAPVTVSFACTDALSGVDAVSDDVVLGTEGADQSAAGTCTDLAGNDASAEVGDIHIDLTSPEASASRAPDANAHGWNNAPVTVSFACTDALSGVDAVSDDAVLDTEGADQSAAGTCTDLAGNSDEATITGVQIDLTAPDVSASRAPEANAHGWNNGPVTVSFACTDALSGLDGEAPEDIVLADEGAPQTADGSCTDLAGNTASAGVGDVNIDLTAPDVSASRAPDANAHGWNNGIVTVSFACTDALSGVDAVSSAAVLGDEGINQGASGSCSDLAGNSAGASLDGVNVDLTPPDLSASRAPDANAHGWNNAPVTVSFACTDALSGVDAVSDDVVLATEGADQGASGACTDLAGNAAEAARDGIRIDLTAPDVSASRAPDANAHGWNNAPVTVSFACTDTLSGVDDVSDDVLLGEGADQSAHGACTDLAGNAAEAALDGIHVDLTAPAIAASTDPPANAHGWNNGPVTVSFACSDALSGVASGADAVVLGAEGVAQSAAGGCEDLAGNAASLTVAGINIDLTPPSADVAAQCATPGEHGWCWGDVNFSASATDALSGLDAIACSLDDAAAACEGLSASADGVHTAAVVATDLAGNTASASAEGQIDTVAPLAGVLVDLVQVGPFEVQWDASDAASGVARIVVQERPLAGLLDDWTDACAFDVAGSSASGTCARDPAPGQYCYRAVARDEAGHETTSRRLELGDDVEGMIHALLHACAIRLAPSVPGLDAAPPQAPAPGLALDAPAGPTFIPGVAAAMAPPTRLEP